jgi:ribosomal subunit interface protein
MEPSPAVETWIREHAAHFERFAERITSFEVTIKSPHKHHHKGQLFRVDLHIKATGGEIVVNRAGPQDHAHEDVYIALRDAFEAARRRLDRSDQRSRRDRSTTRG